MRQQKENEVRKEVLNNKKPGCSCGVTTDGSLLESYKRGMREFTELVAMERKDQDVSESITEFTDDNPILCGDDGFIKYIIGYCSSYVIQNPSITEGSLNDGGIHHLAVFALALIYWGMPRSKGEDIGLESANYEKFRHTASGSGRQQIFRRQAYRMQLLE